jgi:uncharacterized repeat protein (TIGR02543 family)
MTRWLSVFVFFSEMSAVSAAEITARQAETAVAHWLQQTPAPIGTPVGQTVLNSTTHTDDAGSPLFHVVQTLEGGFVVTSADDSVMPIIAFAGNDEAVRDGNNPLWDVLALDLAQRKTAAATRQPLRAPASNAPGRPGPATAAWAALLDEDSARETQGVPSVSDVRVAPLMQSKWGQKAAGGINTYNRLTPNNYPCGCVATAGAQLMRYHEWPTAAVPQETFHCRVNGAGTDLTLFGGPYAWQNMPFVPDSATPTAQRDAISAITRDVGVAVHMQYASSTSGAHTPLLAAAFTDTFGYASACVVSDYESGVDQHLPNAALTNLDAGFPVGLSINGSSGGHAVVGDGYGFSGGQLYVHLNMGWSGNDDVWYNLPVFDTTHYSFSILRGIVYNVFPEWPAAEIISGRVTDASGQPLTGVSILIHQTNGDPPFLAPTRTFANGIYSVLVPSPAAGTYGAWQIVAFDGSTFASQTVATAASTSTRYTYNEISGTYSDPPGDGTIGNRWGVDFVFSAWPVITTAALPPATVGVPYSAALAATGGHPPYRWELALGALPTGLSLNTDGTLGGTPAAAGSYTVEFRVLNANDSYHTTQTFTLTVNGAEGWTYAPAAGTLSHSSTPWVLNVSSSGLALTITNVRVRATSPSPLPLGDPVANGYSIVAIMGRPEVSAEGVFYGGVPNAPGYYIASLTLPASMTSIGTAAFLYCKLLSGRLALPPYVQEIGAYAFMGCSGLTGQLVLPNTLTSLKGGSFSGCGFSDPLIIPPSLTALESNTFGWPGLTGPVFVPDTITSYGIGAINGVNLRELSVPSSGVAFSINAFSAYAALTRVTFRTGYPRSVTSSIFGNSTNVVAYIHLAYLSSWQPHVSGSLLAGTATWQGRPIRVLDPPSATFTVTLDPQGGTSPSPAAIPVAAGIPYGELPATARAGFLFSGWWTAPSGGQRIDSSTPVSVTGDHTLYAHWETSPRESWTYAPVSQTLTHSTHAWVLSATANGNELTVRDVLAAPSAPAPLPLDHPIEEGYRLTAIAETAFVRMGGGSTITGGLIFPESVVDIGAEAFWVCDNITGPLVLPCNATHLAYAAFAGCSGITGHLTLPKRVTTIEDYTFLSCRSLTSIYIPPQVAAVAPSAFVGCSNLRMLVFAGPGSASFAPDYWGMNAVTTYVYAAHADSWNPHVQNGPIEAGNAVWQGRPIRVLDESWTTQHAPVPVPYAWLFQHGNLAPDGDFDAAALRDPDGDTMPTWAEYVAGTDPADAASVFLATIGPGSTAVHWTPDLSAFNRVYTVEGAASLANPVWGPPDADSRFFRVRVELSSP